MSISELQLRRFTLDDLPRAYDLSSSAGSGVTESYWKWVMSMAGDGCFCLTDGDTLVSSAVGLCYGRARGWIALVFTRPEYRRRGLASRVTQSAVDYLSTRVNQIFLDASVAGRPVYERMGFSALFDIEILEGRVSVPQPGSGRRLTPDGLEAVIELDAESFGASRPEVLRRLVSDFPGMAWVDEENGEMTGFALARFSRGATQIGPMMHRSQEGAESLLQTAFHALQSQPIRLDALKSNPAAGQLARKYGLEYQRHCTRMIYGPIPAALNAGENQYAAASPSTG